MKLLFSKSFRTKRPGRIDPMVGEPSTPSDSIPDTFALGPTWLCREIEGTVRVAAGAVAPVGVGISLLPSAAVKDEG